MARTVFYRQCRLVRRVAGGEYGLVSWLPDTFAVVGRAVKLRETAGWQDGWTVIGAGHRRLPASEVPDFHELSKAHLRASGDAD